MEYTQLSLTMEDYQQSKEDIKNNLTGIVKSFVRVGWHLTRIDASGAYKMDGYKSIAEFAKGEYNMTPSGVSRFIKVYKRYSAPGDTPELQEQYKDFNFSQLQEMMQIPEHDHDMILPEAKRESIRDLKHFNAENENNPDNLIEWREEKKEDPVQQTIIDFFRTNKDLMNEIFSSKAWEQQDINGLVDIINPSGNRSHRKGRIFLMMYGLDRGILIKEFQGETTKMSWPEFFQTAGVIFGEAIGTNTYQNYFGGTNENKKDAENTAGRKGIGSTQESIQRERAGNEKKKKQQETAPRDCTGASERTTEGSEPERDIPEQIKPEPEKNTEAEEKTIIAPAQQETETQQSEETILEEMEQVVISRWEYLKKQNRYAAALELSMIAEEADYQKLRTSSFWHQILGEQVNENGERLENPVQQDEQIEGQMSITDIDEMIPGGASDE